MKPIDHQWSNIIKSLGTVWQIKTKSGHILSTQVNSLLLNLVASKLPAFRGRRNRLLSYWTKLKFKKFLIWIHTWMFFASGKSFLMDEKHDSKLERSPWAKEKKKQAQRREKWHRFVRKKQFWQSSPRWHSNCEQRRRHPTDLHLSYIRLKTKFPFQ